MSHPADLANCEDDYRGVLSRAAAAIRAGEDAEVPYFLVQLSQRTLAACALLADADVDVFLDRLDRAGTARLELAQLPARGVQCGEQGMTMAKAMGFPAAVASGNLDLAARIGRVLPDQHNPSWEYEEDFLFHDFIRRAVIGIVDGDANWVHGAAAALARWKAVIKKRESKPLDVCRAILEKNQDAFAVAFPAAVDNRVEQLELYKQQPNFNSKLFATEGHVWIEGLALLEVAVQLGLQVEVEYPLLPSLARSRRSKRSGPTADWLAE